MKDTLIYIGIIGAILLLGNYFPFLSNAFLIIAVIYVAVSIFTGNFSNAWSTIRYFIFGFLIAFVLGLFNINAFPWYIPLYILGCLIFNHYDKKRKFAYINDDSTTTRMIREARLQSSWWWRGLKVFYIFIWLIAFSITGFIAYMQRPQLVEDDSKINVNCQIESNSFWDYSSNYNTLAPDPSMDALYRKECQYGLNKNDYSLLPDVAKNNFNISTYYDSEGSTSSVWDIVIVGFIASFIIIELIKTVFLYIIGMDIWRGFLGFMSSNQNQYYRTA